MLTFLRGLLAAAVALPILAFLFGTRQGEVTFVLYREPKLAAIQILGWSLIGCWVWGHRADLRARDLRAELLRPPWRWLALFLAWGLITGLWIEVPANLFYELSQLFLLLLLVLVLGIWRDPAVPEIVEHGLVLSVGFAVVLGLVQGVFPLAVLSPIDPGSGVANPSLLGYKNVMALAVVGQVFLLARLSLRYGWSRRGRLLGVLLGVELIYLASLQSRTSYLALAGGALVLVPRLGRRRVLWGGLAAALFLAAVAVDPGARGRIGSMLGYLGHPARYLESDRGTYLLNSIQMVRYHPLGVGLGDWQTQYPLYRLHRRDLYFTETIQVRRAHSDHVQVFGEMGWPGLVLWIAFWCSLLAAAVRGSPLLAAQVGAFVFAMLTDSMFEHPYLKLEILLVAFLATRSGVVPPSGELDGGLVEVDEPLVRVFGRSVEVVGRSEGVVEPFVEVDEPLVQVAGPSVEPLGRSGEVSGSPGEVSGSPGEVAGSSEEVPGRFVEVFERSEESAGRLGKLVARSKTALALAFTLLALAGAGYGACLARKVWLASGMTADYVAGRLEEGARAGEAMTRVPGCYKGLGDDYRVLAQIEMGLGRRRRALEHARTSLRFHPWSPNTFRVMADLLRERRPSSAARWSRAADHILNEATHGFESPWAVQNGKESL